MKVRLVFLSTLFLVQLTISQNYQTVEEVNNACATLGFSGDEDAEIAVDKILDQIGMFRNFVLQECPDINNAVAKNISTSSGIKERYILYDNDFFERIDDKAGTDWAAVSVLAHEIGHHLKGHALNDTGSNHQFEIEADNWSGWVLAKMGASLEEAQSAIQTLKYEKATRTHPAKVDRLAAIEKGWNKATGNSVAIIVGDESEEESEEESKKNALEFLRKGEVSYQNNDYTEALYNFKEAKRLGNVDALYYLSNSYYLGQGTIIDYSKAYLLALEGYNNGSIPNTFLLGKYYARGIGTEKNPLGASRLFQKSFHIKWFEDQFKKTNSGSHAYTIGYIYEQGHGGVEKNMKMAIEWYEKAVSLNNPLAANNLGFMYINGIGVKKDLKEALKWYRLAADQGLANAQYNLGAIYNNGTGVKKDLKESVKWYRLAAEQGYVLGQFYLGRNYTNGIGVKKDLKEALKWYRLAADQGLAGAQNNLGNIYKRSSYFGDAIKYYRLAAVQGESNAQYNLGIMNNKGLGIPKNKENAIYWFRFSAKQGNKLAQKELKKMRETW